MQVLQFKSLHRFQQCKSASSPEELVNVSSDSSIGTARAEKAAGVPHGLQIFEQFFYFQTAPHSFGLLSITGFNLNNKSACFLSLLWEACPCFSRCLKLTQGKHLTVIAA